MQKFRDLDSGRKELSTLKARSFFIFIAIGLIFSIFFYQLIELMVLNNSNYITQSDKNRIDTVPIYPARGLIYDSEGNLIVENVVSQDLVLTSPQIQNPGKVIKEIKNSLNLNFIENSLLENINEIKGKKAGQLVLARDLNEMQIAKFQVEKYKWPEINKEAFKNVMINMVIQINGKTRDVLNIKKDLTENEVNKSIKNSSKNMPNFSNILVFHIVSFTNNKFIF